jgi:hypothetical protein
MVRLMRAGAAPSGGSLSLEEVHPNCVDVFYLPEEEKIARARQRNTEIKEYRARILRISGQDHFLTIYPVNTNPEYDDFLKPKYKQITAITLDGFDGQAPDDVDSVLAILEELPSGFVKDFNFGLGLQKDYRFIVDAVEELSTCGEIMIADGVSTGVDADASTIFCLATRDFDNARRSINRTTTRAQQAARSVKSAETYNLFSQSLGREPKPIKIGRHPITKLLTRAAQGEVDLDESAQEQLLKSISNHKETIARAKPAKLAKLHDDIELVTLGVLIGRFDDMLNQRLKESEWQSFFNENPFILGMAFGYPIVKVKDQASIGGRKLSGAGEKITDFLVKNSLTNNTALFEIKTPQTPLLSSRSYREGVFTPTQELSGSINQALDQRYQFQKQISQIKDTSSIYDIESYAVHSCLIIGKTPSDADQQKSFEMFRRNSKEVQIVTFDELLEKLKQLHDFLGAKENYEGD